MKSSTVFKTCIAILFIFGIVATLIGSANIIIYSVSGYNNTIVEKVSCYDKNNNVILDTVCLKESNPSLDSIMGYMLSGFFLIAISIVLMSHIREEKSR
jgi:hypothetical protein